MTLYIANLLQPSFGKGREALLHNPMAGESHVPIIRCEATTTSNPIREPEETMQTSSSTFVLSFMTYFLNPDSLR